MYKSSLTGLAVALCMISLALPVALADSDNLSVVLNATLPPSPPAPTIYESAGGGIAGFLTAINAPVVDFMIAMGIVAFILAVLYVFSDVFRNAVGGQKGEYPTSGEYKTQ